MEGWEDELVEDWAWWRGEGCLLFDILIDNERFYYLGDYSSKEPDSAAERQCLRHALHTDYSSPRLAGA